MHLEKRKNTIAKLGKIILESYNNPDKHNFPDFSNIYYQNPWFSEDFVKHSLEQWHSCLELSQINKWTSCYKLDKLPEHKIILLDYKKNKVPFLWLYDIISSIICGLNIKIKINPQDDILLNWIINCLIKIDSSFSNSISIEDAPIKNFHAIITDDNQKSFGYFEKYMSKTPHLINKDKQSIAILNGNETEEELKNLAKDIFINYGIGKASISKLYIPIGYNFSKLNTTFNEYQNIINSNKYSNNLDYQYSLLSIKTQMHIKYDNILLIESKELNSPIGVVYYEFYNSSKNLNKLISCNSEKLYHIVSTDKEIENRINFGDSNKISLKKHLNEDDSLSFILNFIDKNGQDLVDIKSKTFIQI